MSRVKRKKEKIFDAPAAPPYAAILGSRIRLVRLALELSQEEMSRRLGRANNNAVSRLERGAADMISIDVLGGLIEMAAEAGYSTDWFLSGQELPISDTAARLLKELQRLAAAEPRTPRDKEGV